MHFKVVAFLMHGTNRNSSQKVFKKRERERNLLVYWILDLSFLVQGEYLFPNVFILIFFSFKGGRRLFFIILLHSIFSLKNKVILENF